MLGGLLVGWLALAYATGAPYGSLPGEAPYAWRNDSQNLALTRAWNAYLAATPFSDDVSGVSDNPPVSLDWSLGQDNPLYGQKDGVGCWIGAEFVISGGIWTSLRGGQSSYNLTMSYNTATNSWSALPAPPFVQTRGTGTCTDQALYLVGGRETSGPGKGRSVARLARGPDGRWEWSSLPALPADGWRWLGAAGVADGWLMITTGTNTSKFQLSSLRTMGDPTSEPLTIPSYRLRLDDLAAGWQPMAPFPGGGLDAPNTAVVKGKLYVLGGWRGSVGGMSAWSALFSLGLPVPIVEGTNGGKLIRACWRYDPTADSWERIPDAPYHIEFGGTAVLQDRYLLSLGSTHGKNSFRVGVNCGHDPACGKALGGVPDMGLGSGVLTYYGDDVLAFDTELSKWSRVGKLVYGCITSHCGTNGTHVICIAGEPRHGHNGNSESAVQIALITNMTYEHSMI